MHGVRSLLSDRRYRRFVLARTISLFGSTMAPIALSFAILGLGPGEQATELGIVLFTRYLAQVIFTLGGGVLADRFSRQRTMVIADLAAALTQALVAVLLLLGQASVPLLVVLSFVNGLAASVFIPAADGVMPLLVPPDRVKDANATRQTGENIARLLGAGGAGLSIALAGPAGALLVDAATFLVSAVLIAGLGLPTAERSASRSVLTDLRGGVREVTSRRWMLVGLGQFAVLNYCNAGGIYVLGPVIAEEHFRGAVGWSLALGAQTVGFLLGSLVALRLQARRPLVVATVWTLAWPLPLLALAGHLPLAVFVATMAVAGMGTQISEVLSRSVVQTQVPTSALSRVASIDLALSFTLVPLGFAAVGPFSQVVGVGRTLLVYAAVMVASAGLALTSRSLRSITAVRQGDVAPAGPSTQSG